MEEENKVCGVQMLGDGEVTNTCINEPHKSLKLKYSLVKDGTVKL